MIRLFTRTALLAGVNTEQRIFLFFRRCLIDMDHRAPVAFEYVSRNVRSEAHGEPGYVYTIDFPSVKMMRNHGVASAVIRIDPDPTGAEHLAIADFEKTSLEFVSHMHSPFDLLAHSLIWAK